MRGEKCGVQQTNSPRDSTKNVQPSDYYFFGLRRILQHITRDYLVRLI